MPEAGATNGENNIHFPFVRAEGKRGGQWRNER
jgi:hypothetical protein